MSLLEEHISQLRFRHVNEVHTRRKQVEDTKSQSCSIQVLLLCYILAIHPVGNAVHADFDIAPFIFSDSLTEVLHESKRTSAPTIATRENIARCVGNADIAFAIDVDLSRHDGTDLFLSKMVRKRVRRSMFLGHSRSYLQQRYSSALQFANTQ